MSGRIGKTGIGLAGMAVAAVFGLGEVSQAGTVVVSPPNMDGWAFQFWDSNGNPIQAGSGDVAQMVTGPAAPPLGTGSAELALSPTDGNAGDAALIYTNAYNGTKLSEITALSYSTYDAYNNGQQLPYMLLKVTTGDSSYPTDSIFFEPPYQTVSTGNSTLPDQGATTMSTWQTWNAEKGGWWADSAYSNKAPDYKLMGPGSGGTYGTVQSINTYLSYPGFSNATIEGIYLIVGWAGGGSYGSHPYSYQGYVDNVSIGTSTGTTTYDFEATPIPASAGLVGVGSLALLGGAALRRRMAAKL